ncbi:MAG: sugar kinase [Elusimicrobia bacterium]|nr:sugar kinase [Elusimicrobiota bacterium]MDE2236752.1 sugar kinase [Elusimicrobiota bacterium]MDE2426107.1 sugar kinase [Elusimicrobiota bacterium]
MLVVGSVALDSVKTSEGEVSEVLGGSASYFSLSARQFAPVSIVGVVGRDFPRRHRELLASRGVDLSGFRELPGRTFRWSGRYGCDGNEAETLDTQLNVFADFKPKLSASQAASEAVFLANIDPELQAEVLSQMRRPSLTACDTMNYWIRSKPEALKALLSRVDVFFANEDEAKALAGQPNALRAARALSSWGPRVVVIKKGEHGALLRAAGKTYAFPAFPLETVKDPTGAGDTFAGGFMGYLACRGGLSDVGQLKRAMLYGSVMASFTVQEFSTKALEDLERGEVDRRFNDLLERLAVPYDPVLIAVN